MAPCQQEEETCISILSLCLPSYSIKHSVWRGQSVVVGLMGEPGVWGTCMDTVPVLILYFLGNDFKEHEVILQQLLPTEEKGAWHRTGAREDEEWGCRTGLRPRLHVEQLLDGRLGSGPRKWMFHSGRKRGGQTCLQEVKEKPVLFEAPHLRKGPGDSESRAEPLPGNCAQT